MTHEEWQKYNTRELLWIMDSRVARLEHSIQTLRNMVRYLTKLETVEMTALQDVKNELEATRTEVARNGDVEQSAITLIHKLMDMVGNAAATATDLQELQASIATIRGQVKDEADGLGAAVAAAP